MKRVLLLFGFLVFSLTAGGAPACTLSNPSDADALPPSKLKAAQIRAELDCIVDVLEAVHPHLHVYRSRQAFSKLAKDLREGAENALSLDDAHSYYQRLLSAVCDEHTSVRMPTAAKRGWPYADQGLPMPLYVVGERVYGRLRAKVPKRGRSAGDTVEIVRIGERSAAEIRDFIISQRYLDGCAERRHVHFPDHALHKKLTGFIGPRAVYPTRVRLNDGTETEIEIGGRDGRSLSRLLNHERMGTLAFPFLRVGFENVHRAGDWFYHRNPKTDVGYLYVSDFLDVEDDAVDGIMRRILKDNPGSLIVDLSNNPGGLLSTAMRMNSYLIPRAHRPFDTVRARRAGIYRSDSLVLDEDRKQLARQLRQFRNAPRAGRVRSRRAVAKAFGHPDYKGKLYVLVSHRTGSAASSSAFVLKRYRSNVTLIGTDTRGGAKWGCLGARGYYVLPHSKMRLYVPQQCTERQGDLAERFGFAVGPDLRIEPRIDYLHVFGMDLMQATLRHIANN